jgi:hypothetical protein
MKSLINLQDVDITKPEQFAKFVAAAKEIQGQLDAAWGYVEQSMLDGNVTQLKGEWGTVSLAERKNWKATTVLPPRYYKQTLDTAKLNFLYKAGEQLPAGAEFTTSQYITKRIK